MLGLCVIIPMQRYIFDGCRKYPGFDKTSSPVMLPYKSLFQIDKSEKTPVFQQLTNQWMALIRRGVLKPGQKIPGTRRFSDMLEIHRKTAVRVYFELTAQGWLEAVSGQGTFIAASLPELKPGKLTDAPGRLPGAGFDFEVKPFLKREVVKSTGLFHLDDGFPDPRLAPLTELGRAYRNNLTRGNTYQRLGYGETQGTAWLRQELAGYLSETRGLNITAENIIVVRGTVMGLYLACLALVRPGDHVVTGASCWLSARTGFMQAGAQLHQVPVDENGLDVDALEALCRQQAVRMLYLTPHHDYPTTVTLKADRRIRLLDLAARYRFIIFEDDYDYDFHYLGRPLLPLASADRAGVVLYSGSFTKSISPAFRVGYLVGPEEVIEHLSYYRRIIDRQGDNILENAVAELLQDGVIQKYLRKALRQYRQRKEVFSTLLKDRMGDIVTLQVPEGGMACWTVFDPAVDLTASAAAARKQGLYFSDGVQHNSPEKKWNGTRLGFASSTPEELEQSVEILRRSIIMKR